MDIVLIGSGVSSTLLAETLARVGGFRSLRVIGPETTLGARRFSYWSDTPTPFDRYADGSWSRFRIASTDGAIRDLTLDRFVYRTFEARRWHADARRRLHDASGVELIDDRVESVDTVGERAVVHTPNGRFEADWVFSSARSTPVPPTAWQRFEGWEISLDEDLIDCDTATWLDFRTETGGDFRFVYALPLGPHRLFVEHVSYQPSRHGEALQAYLRDVLRLRRWDTLTSERGATPLYSPHPPRRVGRLVRIGVGAGLAKTCTGYAIMRMWRDAEAITASLKEHGHPVISRPQGGLYRAADRFFLSQLNRGPNQLPDFLLRLGGSVTGDAFLAFLDDRATVAEQIDICRAAPDWIRELAGVGRIPTPGRRHPPTNEAALLR